MKVPEEETLNNYILCKRNTPMSWVGKKHFLVRKTMIITTGFQCSSNWQQADLLRDKWVLNDSPGPCSFIIQEWYHSALQPGANRSWLALCRLIISKTVFVEFSQTVPNSMISLSQYRIWRQCKWTFFSLKGNKYILSEPCLKFKYLQHINPI